MDELERLRSDNNRLDAANSVVRELRQEVERLRAEIEHLRWVKDANVAAKEALLEENARLRRAVVPLFAAFNEESEEVGHGSRS